MIGKLNKYRKYLILFLVFFPYAVFYSVAFLSNFHKSLFWAIYLIYYFVFFTSLFLEAENAKWLSMYSRHTKIISCLAVTLFFLFLTFLVFT
jgi:hypothetical protein